jgi:hypothetical protein
MFDQGVRAGTDGIRAAKYQKVIKAQMELKSTDPDWLAATAWYRV